MTGLVRRWRGLFGTLHHVMPLGFEVALTLLSLHASYVLLTDQQYFDHHALTYAWLTKHVAGEEWIFGLLALTAAVCKAAGLACLTQVSDRAMDAAFVLREFGWGLSFVFWLGLGVTFSAADPGSIGSFSVLALAVFALGMMVAGPVMPSDPHAGG